MSDPTPTGDSLETLTDAVRAVAAGQRRETGEHPTPAELLAYHDGELTGDRRESLQDHLALCPQCARAVLDMAVFPEVEILDQDQTPTDDQIRDELASMHRRLEAQEEVEEAGAEVIPLMAAERTVSGPVSAAPAAASTHPRFQTSGWPIAAVLALAVAGLGLWVQSLRTSLSELAEFSGGVPGLELNAGGLELNVGIDELSGLVERGAASDAAGTQVIFRPQDKSRLLVLTYFDPTREFAEFGLRVEDPAGQEILAASLERLEVGTFTLLVHRGDLETGLYRFLLHGVAGADWRLLETYPVEIVYES